MDDLFQGPVQIQAAFRGGRGLPLFPVQQSQHLFLGNVGGLGIDDQLADGLVQLVGVPGPDPVLQGQHGSVGQADDPGAVAHVGGVDVQPHQGGNVLGPLRKGRKPQL